MRSSSRRDAAVATAAVCAALVGGSTFVASASTRAVDGEELRAFERPKRPNDALRGSFANHLGVTDSRRIASYTDRRGRRSVLYVAKTRTQLCIVGVNFDPAGAGGGSGGGCSPTASFFAGRHVAATSGRLFEGVVANEVARVVLVGSRGVRHPVKVTADGGFIYDCRAYNGCAGLIACVEAYARDGKFLSSQPWSGRSCRRR